ncbi:hypothetical protein EV426DRAFT_572602 [Tirmania nivea]|nr:hypothetical protein EV426DRAFT_572602 [Tirmania nivea]
MNHIPGSYGAITGEPQDTTNPSVIPPPRNIHPNFTNLIRALDEALSELRTLEIKYMLERDPSNNNGGALNIPFLLRLKFRIKGKRDLETILAELERHNWGLKGMIEEVRKIVRWNLEISARQMPNVEPRPTADKRIPPEVETSFSITGIESSNLDSPPVDAILPPAHISIPLPAEDTTAIDNPPQPPSSLARRSSASFERGIDTYGREFQSSDSFTSYERQDNYSIHTGDQICTQCHQVWRKD